MHIDFEESDQKEDGNPFEIYEPHMIMANKIKIMIENNEK